MCENAITKTLKCDFCDVIATDVGVCYVIVILGLRGGGILGNCWGLGLALSVLSKIHEYYI